MSAAPQQKLVAVLGPTASGKTALAVQLAQQFDGEVISADSRQVYRGLDIGTGKVIPEEMDGIPHHLIDICDPTQVYTASDFVRGADEAISDISERGKLPILAGGTFFYVEALLGTKTLAAVPPNETLRAALEEKTNEELVAELEAKDPARAETIDTKNRRRLIRALEVVEALGSVPSNQGAQRYDTLLIGIDMPQDVLDERIRTRLLSRFEEGMVKEACGLHENGLSFERMETLGLEYRYMARHLKGDLTYEELVPILEQKIRQYAKRQLTWLRKMENVHWIPYDTPEEAADLVRDFGGGR